MIDEYAFGEVGIDDGLVLDEQVSNQRPHPPTGPGGHPGGSPPDQMKMNVVTIKMIVDDCEV